MGAGDVILIRHAEADYDGLTVWEPIFTGMRRDFAPLTREGVTQAEGLAQSLKGTGLRLIVSSPYTRSLQTTAVIAAQLACPIVVDPRLHDWLPVRDGRHLVSAAIVAEKIKEHELSVHTGTVPSSRTWETADEMRERLTAVITDHRSDLPFALVAHEAPIQSIIGPVSVPVASAHAIDASALLRDGAPIRSDSG